MSKYKKSQYTRQEKLIESSDIFSGDEMVLLGMSGGTDSSVAESSWRNNSARNFFVGFIETTVDSMKYFTILFVS